MIQVRGLDHVVLRVVDMAAMVAFYEGVLGCPVEWRRDEFGLVHLRAGSAQIDLVDVSGPLGRAGGAAAGTEARNMDHFCLAVDPFDADAIVRHLAVHGVKTGEIARRFGAGGEGPSLYVADPEGNTVELKGPADRARA